MISRRALVPAAVLLLWLGCDESAPSESSEERGGAAGAPEMGQSGSGGSAGASDAGEGGAVVGVAGATEESGGKAGGATQGGSGGGGEIATCESLDGPRAVGDFRPMIPFDLRVSGGCSVEDENVGGGCSEGDNPEPSGCSKTDSGGWHCDGVASVFASGLTSLFVFGDDSRLEWSGEASDFVAPPDVEFKLRVWIDYARETFEACPFCETHHAITLTILSEEGGDLLWFGQEGSRLAELEATRIDELFGVAARREATCTSDPYEVDCYDVERTLFDHVLETDPEQLVPHATRTRVVTPGGSYEVTWASSDERSEPRENCDDGNVPAYDRGFAASRLRDPAPPCPDEPPEELSLCPSPPQRCSYPDAPEEPCPEACGDECRDVYVCGSAGWYLENRPPGCGAPDAECPAEMPAEVDPCSVEGLRCRYEEALCFCSCGVLDEAECDQCANPNEPDQPGTQAWACTTVTDEGCPAVLPRAGEPCDLPGGTNCDGYAMCFGCGDFSSAPFRVCTDGVWEDAHGDCQP